LFVLYTSGIRQNPPGFYLDESATAYNAYLVSRTGAGEFGTRFPVLFQFYSGIATTFVNPVTIYLLALVFRFLPPGILVARIFAAFWTFAACLLLGLLGTRISGQRRIGIIVGATALLTPWFFEISRLVWDAHFIAPAIVFFLVAAYDLQKKEMWRWCDILLVPVTLVLLTYGYLAGRVLAPLFALGLLFFATTKHRLIGIGKIWLFYGLSLVPIFVFNVQHPGAVSQRYNAATYLHPGVPWREAAAEFIGRYLEDQSVIGPLQTGHPLPRHHVVEAGGVFFFATYALALLGLLIVVLRHRGDPWWRFALYGLAMSILPGVITYEPFHMLRLMALPVFLTIFTIPALQWLLARDIAGTGAFLESFSRPMRLGLLFMLLGLTTFEAGRFQKIFRREGPNRGLFFDAPYKNAYDAAVAQPARPIYLFDGHYGPDYIHAFWYATIEGRPRSEFVHLGNNERPPPGAIVLSSEQECEKCEMIERFGIYLLYRAK
jgi:hypothetical protein